MTLKRIALTFSDRNRQRKYQLFMDRFRPSPDTRILDVGASEDEYQENANIIEKRYPHPEKITALGIDEFKEFPKRYPKVKAVRYTGGRFPFGDKEFDILWSNAVLEHVGGEENMVFFLKEAKRVAKAAFVTTPNRYFPFEVHTKLFLIHWLPKAAFDRVLKALSMGWAAGDYMHLMTERDLKRILARCGIERYEIVKNRIWTFTVDFVIIF